MKSPIPVAPVLAGPLNCEQLLATKWRPLRALCRAKGIPIAYVGRRPVVRIDLVLRALGLADAPSEEPPKSYGEDEIVELASRRKAGAR